MTFEFDPKRSAKEITEFNKESQRVAQGLVPSWSFSAIEKFEKCRWSTYLSRVKKVKGESSEAMDRGTKIHNEAEAFIKGETDKLIPELSKYKNLFAELRAEFNTGVMYIEEEWGYTSKWGVTGYFSPDTWLRVKLDAAVMHSETDATLYDWKSGKKFGNEMKHAQQAMLYAIAAFKRFDTLQHVTIKFVYVDHNTTPLVKTYSREKADIFVPKWEERAFKLTTATENDFYPNASPTNCQWCPHADSGNCEYSRKQNL